MKLSSIANKYPTNRDDILKGCKKWLDGRRLDDNAEGLWRIHDKLYNLKDFVKRHPGGELWLEVTEGTDITEHFETHHIKDTAERMLEKFFVRDAKLQRNYKISFKENGFYKTVKRRVAQKVDHLDHSAEANSRFYCDFLLVTLILLSTISARDENYLVATAAALSLSWLTTIGHNFIHQKDNWRMYLVNLSLMTFREWRVFHVMSHHLYPNSYHDLEVSFFLPMMNWMPEKKSLVQKIAAWISSPFAYMLLFFFEFKMRITNTLFCNQKLHWDDLLPFALPTFMFFFGNTNALIVLKIWTFIVFMGSFIYGFVSINAGHHHNEIFHEGDELKSMDFGIYQLAATIDRSDVKDSLFLTLTNFGNHILHHFFPTLDHSLLPQLNEIFFSTCMEFECEMRELPWWQLISGQFHQLHRENIRKLKRDVAQ